MQNIPKGLVPRRHYWEVVESLGNGAQKKGNSGILFCSLAIELTASYAMRSLLSPAGTTALKVSNTASQLTLFKFQCQDSLHSKHGLFHKPFLRGFVIVMQNWTQQPPKSNKVFCLIWPWVTVCQPLCQQMTLHSVHSCTSVFQTLLDTSDSTGQPQQTGLSQTKYPAQVLTVKACFSGAVTRHTGLCRSLCRADLCSDKTQFSFPGHLKCSISRSSRIQA